MRCSILACRGLTAPTALTGTTTTSIAGQRYDPEDTTEYPRLGLFVITSESGDKMVGAGYLTESGRISGTTVKEMLLDKFLEGVARYEQRIKAKEQPAGFRETKRAIRKPR
jgi:hypothetical protein